MEFLLYLVLGAAAGVLAGLFGVGGGLIIVPVLVFSFQAQGVAPDVLTHLAVGTSLATIVFTSANSVLAHHRRGAVLWNIVRWLTPGILLGGLLGGATAAQLQGPLLQKIIGVFVVLMAVQMGFDVRPKARRPVPGVAGLVASGGVIGWASAIVGIGGGSITVPFLTWRSVPMLQAVATSAACGLPIACAGAYTNPTLQLGKFGTAWPCQMKLSAPALMGIAATSMIFARFGAQLAHKLPAKVLKRLFALLLLSVGLTFLF